MRVKPPPSRVAAGIAWRNCSTGVWVHRRWTSVGVGGGRRRPRARTRLGTRGGGSGFPSVTCEERQSGTAESKHRNEGDSRESQHGHHVRDADHREADANDRIDWRRLSSGSSRTTLMPIQRVTATLPSIPATNNAQSRSGTTASPTTESASSTHTGPVRRRTRRPARKEVTAGSSTACARTHAPARERRD